MKLFTNWKTTSAGLVMIIGAICDLIFSAKIDKSTIMEFSIALFGGVGFLFTKDFNVTGGNKEQGSGDPKL